MARVNQTLRAALLLSAALTAVPAFAHAADAQQSDGGLLFHLTGDKGLTADVAGGVAVPNFADKVKIQKDPVHGPYIEASGDETLSWMAPGNIYAQRGTLSFYWRAREPVGTTPFPLFRVGYADHTSWDMAWLRIDWNGKGFDAFVTDDNLARVRVSTTAEAPKADRWILVTFTWDEAKGIALYIDGKPVASKAQAAALDAGLDQFGPHSRVISPHQVQSAYQFIRGGDVDDIRVYDHALDDAAVAGLAAGKDPAPAAAPATTDAKTWLYRYGWNRPADPPPYLADARTTIRKVEFTDQYDIKERMSLGSDGIPETTWPGVYNRSKLPGRHDYFELPDWNVYVEGGKAVTFTLPDEPYNRLEFQGAAYGSLTTIDAAGKETPLAKRPKGELRTFNQFAALKGGKLRFDNVVQETPIQELGAYNVSAAAEPDEFTLSYVVRPGADPATYPTLDELSTFVKGRYAAGERTTVAALPAGAPLKARADVAGPSQPIVHILIPADFRLGRPGGPVGKFEYGWQGADVGLDGVAIDIPALNVKATHGGLFPLNIKVKDPLWPGRDLLDVNVSVKPGEARTVFLDTRDRILPAGKSLYLSIAGAGSDFDAKSLDGMAVRLKFKPADDAKAEHVADRLAQARDNLAFLVEEHDVSKRLARYARLDLELSDLLKVDPKNPHGREMWFELNPEQPGPAVTLPTAPAGVPKWAFLQVEDLKRVRKFIEWWIDNRQSPYGDFGGGISDDNDLTHQWPPLALMGDIPDKTTASLNALLDAAYKNDMMPLGLGKIKTDELHSYEEAINLKAEAMYTSFGDPKIVERLMETARAYPTVMHKAEDGHVHAVSRFFSATDVSRDGPWGWSHPYSYLILHPGIVLADFNGDPTIKKLIVDLADGHLAHGKQDPDGTWRFPEDIHAATGQSRGELVGKGRGNVSAMQLFWAAWRWTGDDKYLRPLQGEMARTGLKGVDELNSDVIDMLGLRDAQTPGLKAAIAKGADDPFLLYEAWRSTGDTAYLEKAYGDEIVTAEQRMWMVTEAHWWSDRVELSSAVLQRSRLGAMALARNQMFPGALVSWRFDTPTAAEDVGILVTGGQKSFKVTGYNLTAQPIHAVMTGWDVAAGRWSVTRAVEGASDPAASVALERTVGLDMTFAPGKTTTWEFALQTPAATPVTDRPDLGIGRDDVKAGKSGLTITVHSLGAKPAPASVVVVEDASGKELARTTTPVLPAPLDLKPKTVQVSLKAGWKTGYRVRILTPADAPEITQLNNTVIAP
ncbi:LamG-like jellyroll fold domain-containing protein [Caulobacter sp. UNC358MFTsu5.1]|uniref:LamG-like jellyroll fold domain-containing protein n=1 Tax=Caulobacter sp. UNC358MFTsu5.1 TaxID=1449049 RepID=UPI0004A6BAE2|nr:LamG-like jellyroll fold domain-containing protein [Caulobacter sp. UNC358MFTsu5.1]